MFCASCGTKVEKDVKYCSSCGTNLAGSKSANNSKSPQSHHNQKNSGTVYIVLGWIFFVISLLFIPILFGAGTFIMGYLLRKSGKETHGTILMVMAIAGAIFGTLLGMAAAGL